MRNVPNEITKCTTLCNVWIMTLRDDSQLGFTDHDRVLEVKGVSCLPQSGFTAENANGRAGLDPSEAEVAGILDDARITAADIRSGRFDGARIDHHRVNWAKASQYVHMATGLIGEIKQKGAAFEAQWRGEASLLERSAGRVFSRLCDAEFGDTRCGINKAAYPDGTVCARTILACREQFSNSLNFRGFPYLLGDDALVAVPQEGEPRDGGSRFS